MKEASRTINVIISNLPDNMEEDDLEFVVDVSKIEVTASLKVGELRKTIPKKRIDIDVEEDVYIRNL
ncbi:hypothetical protein MUP59_01790 [Candidatus Bathyarchaeota archaeon]|nr:hypothetical protein [Candidatus Bathyarchaeota archaeon]